VLANEQVEGGLCERCGSVVEQRFLEQWFFRITDYAGRLLANLDDQAKMDWSATTATAQRNWIGRSEGAELDFAVDQGTLTVYTTRPDTIFGATFMVVAPEHPMVPGLTTDAQRDEVEAYRRAAAAKDLVSRKVGDREKTGVFTGGYAINPATGEPIPVWLADYVLMDYGTGAIMAVPGHDERDFAFARKFGLPIVRVIAGDGQDGDTPLDEAYVETAHARLVNSAQFNDLPAEEAQAQVTSWLATRGVGRMRVQYRLYDWCISRQRYWGPPIPIIYCDACGAVPVPEQDLPVVLPPIEDFRPDDTGVSPLARHEEWYYVPCPACGARARRETDVSDTFLDSAWYYLRYPSTEFADRPFDPARTRKWCPVATYIGGNEHAVLHLLYSRFLAMVLHDLGQLHFEEPFAKFRAHGLIVKDGSKMSKSRGNVVIPDEYIARWGADSFRMYLMFLGPFGEGGDFRDAGISGVRRFLDKVWLLVGHAAHGERGGEMQRAFLSKWNRTKKKVGEDLESLSYNTAIAALMEMLNAIRETNCSEPGLVEEFVVMLAPFAPHFAEECWERLGHDTSVFDARWPAWDPGLLHDDTLELPVQVSGKTRGKVQVARGAGEAEVAAAARADDALRRFLEGKAVRKVIYVPNRLINFVLE
jgi:leucyl-tRNA synthetase